MKERIIGAAVLVLFVVLVVPVFLDGPANDAEVVSEPVLLPGQEEQETRTIVLDRDRTEPVPSGSGSGDNAKQESDLPQTTPAAEPSTAVRQSVEPPPAEKQAEDPQPAEKTPAEQAPADEPVIKAVATSTTGMWAVQLGSFSNKENAEKLAADLRKQAYAAFLSQLETDNGPLHRVRIGPQKDRESAEAMAARLAKAGHKGQVVPHP